MTKYEYANLAKELLITRLNNAQASNKLGEADEIVKQFDIIYKGVRSSIKGDE